MKYHFIALTFGLIAFLNFGSAQKKEKAPLINYKLEILPLLQNSKLDEAIPVLKKYYAQNVLFGDIWRPKVLLLEAEYMYNTQKLIAVDFDSRAFKSLSIPLADSSIIWYNRMLITRHADSLFAKDRIVALNNGKVQFPLQFAEKRRQQELAEVQKKKFIEDSLEQRRILNENRELFVKDSSKNAQKIQFELQAYNLAKKAQKITTYKSFIREFPESNYLFEIDTLCSNLALKIADSIKTIRGYQAFLDSFPQSIYFNNTIDKLLKLAVPQNISTMTKLTDVNKAIAEVKRLNDKSNFGFDFDKLNHFSEVNLNSGDWTIPNLNVSHFANGDTIFQAKTNQEWVKATNDKKPAWCYYDNNSENSSVNGKLYNWYAVNDSRGLTSSNYVVPSIDDYMKLVADEGGMSSAGKKLKCPSDWQEEQENLDVNGFNALSIGYRDEQGNFVGKGQIARFWIKGADANSIKFAQINKNLDNVVLNQEAQKGFGFSVRLLKYYEDAVYSYSAILEKLLLKRDELLLKEYGLIKEYRKINSFLLNQLKSELGIKHLKEEELSQEQFQFLIQRFYSNEEIVKNGNFIIPPFYTDLRCENDGDGSEDAPSPQIIHGFKDGVFNYIKWENGETYTGEIVDGYPNGKGTKTLPNGTKLIGVFVYGSYISDDTYTNKEEQNIPISSYNGQLYDGTYHYSDGIVYEIDLTVCVDGWEICDFTFYHDANIVTTSNKGEWLRVNQNGVAEDYEGPWGWYQIQTDNEYFEIYVLSLDKIKVLRGDNELFLFLTD